MRPKTKSDARKTAVRYPQHGFAKIADACQFLAIGRTTLFKLMKRGRIETIRLDDSNSHRRIPWPALWAYKTQIDAKLSKAGGGTSEYVAPK